jgi:hypothetical protein
MLVVVQQNSMAAASSHQTHKVPTKSGCPTSDEHPKKGALEKITATSQNKESGSFMKIFHQNKITACAF